VTKHEGNTSRALKNNVEGSLGIPFSYVKHRLFSQAWKLKKDDGLHSERKFPTWTTTSEIFYL
jgi:hypothetical protein